MEVRAPWGAAVHEHFMPNSMAPGPELRADDTLRLPLPPEARLGPPHLQQEHAGAAGRQRGMFTAMGLHVW